MTRLAGTPIVTAAQMRAAEAATIAAGTSADTLMARAGAAVAEQVRRLAVGGEVLVLCGPGNNGGDGYVAAAALRRLGMAVRVAASADPATPEAVRARAGWDGPVEPLADAAAAPMLVDALFGTGLSRPLIPAVGAALARLLAAAERSVAVDLPSGVAADDGARLAEPSGDARFSLTLALGAAKPAHVLHPAAALCGAVRVVDIGVAVDSATRVVTAPELPPPGPADHKYSRGMVAVVAGAMPGAARLAGIAALRVGAGYAALFGDAGAGGPAALVHRDGSAEALADRRIGAIVIGPGLGRDDGARARLDAVIAADTAPLVIDGDALHLLDLLALAQRTRPVVLTPHQGEFEAVFGDLRGSPLDRARAAARRAGVVVVLKGATTVAADRDRAIVAPGGSAWLSTAGTGDVLAGAIGAMLARGGDPLDAAAAGIWYHAEAARIAGASFIADDLAEALSAARAGA